MRKEITIPVVAMCLFILVSFSRAQEIGDIGMLSFSSVKARRFVLTADEAEECLFLAVNGRTPFLGIEKSTVYLVRNASQQPILKRIGTISHLFSYRGFLYYVLHDTYTWRGRLICCSRDGKRNKLLLDESYGVGAILGAIDDNLYIETESNIVKLNLSNGSIETIAEKHYYVTNATENGITYYDGEQWIFRSWKCLTQSETIFYNSENILFSEISAYSPQHYMVYDRDKHTLCVSNPASSIELSDVLSVSSNNGMIAAVISNNSMNALCCIDLYDETLSKTWITLPSTIDSCIFLHDRMIYYINNNNQLQSIGIEVR